MLVCPLSASELPLSFLAVQYIGDKSSPLLFITKCVYFPFSLKDTFDEYIIKADTVLPFSFLKMIFYYLLVCTVFNKKSAVYLSLLPTNNFCFFPLAAFNIFFSLSLVFNNLIMVCFNMVFSVEVYLPSWVCAFIFSITFGKKYFTSSSFFSLNLTMTLQLYT